MRVGRKILGKLVMTSIIVDVTTWFIFSSVLLTAWWTEDVVLSTWSPVIIWGQMVAILWLVVMARLQRSSCSIVLCLNRVSPLIQIVVVEIVSGSCCWVALRSWCLVVMATVVGWWLSAASESLVLLMVMSAWCIDWVWWSGYGWGVYSSRVVISGLSRSWRFLWDLAAFLSSSKVLCFRRHVSSLIQIIIFQIIGSTCWITLRRNRWLIAIGAWWLSATF